MATVNPTMAVTAPKVLSFLSWNLNGLASALKKKEYLPKKMVEVDVVFFQETHIGERNKNLIQQFTDWHLHYTTYDTRKRGVAILVNKKVHFRQKEVFEHPDGSLKGEIKHREGGYLVLICEIEGQPYTLVSVYHYHKNKDILTELSSVLQKHASGVLVIGGDFNTVLNPYIDKMSPKPNPGHLKLLQQLKPFITSLQLVDVWRRKVQNHFFMSYHCKKNASRIDYFFLPEECVWRVQKCKIEDIPADDHLPISLQLNMEVIRKDPNLDSEEQHRPDYETSVSGCMGNLSFSRQWIENEDIKETIKSLQMSDTPRPNGRTVTTYKSDPEAVPGLKSLYKKITDGSFDCQSHQFNESIPKQTCYFNSADSQDSAEEDATQEHSDSPFCPRQTFHFFNVNYVILATILARRLESELEIKQGKWPQQPNLETHYIMFCHFVQYETIPCDWNLIEKSLKNVLKHDADKYLKALKNILKNYFDSPQHKLLCLGCPLTPMLRSFLLKYYAENDLNSHKQSDSNPNKTVMVDVFINKDSESPTVIKKQERSEDVKEVKAYVHGDFVIALVPKEEFKRGRDEVNYYYRFTYNLATFLRPYDAGNGKRKCLSKPDFGPNKRC